MQRHSRFWIQRTRQQQQQRRHWKSTIPATFSTTSTSTSTSTWTTTTNRNTLRWTLPMVYKQFKLETFQREELERVFDQIVNSKQNANANAVAASTTTTTTNPSSLSPPTVDIHALTQFLINRNHHPSTPMEPKAEKKNLTQPTQPATQISSQQEQAQQILDWLSPPKNSQESTATSSSSIQLTRSQFVERITTLASTVDYKASAPVILSMWLVGTSVGVMNPVMPFLVEALQLSASQYGTVVSGFAASKMICNIPAAILVERHGRKPYMVGSLIWIAMGVMGMGCAETAWQLYACRFVTGMGVAALSTAGTLLVSDLSTPLNRASTYAPVLSAFATGTAFGPALGGYLVDTIGIQTTLYAVGCSYMGVAALNKAILTETKMNNNDTTPIISSSTKAGATTSRGSLSNEISNAVSQWGQLIYHHPAIRSVVALNGIYWMALSGSQMTLLPLILTEDLGFTATQVGQVYMGMSLVQILGNPVFAKISDTIGKVPVMVVATSLIGGAMATLPYCCGMVGSNTGIEEAQAMMPLFYMTLGLWSVGSSMLSTAPLAYVTDRVGDQQRAQAIALMRTCGDVGFLLGATSTGWLADWTGSLGVAMQSSAGVLLSATVWFAIRQMFLNTSHFRNRGNTSMANVKQ